MIRATMAFGMLCVVCACQPKTPAAVPTTPHTVAAQPSIPSSDDYYGIYLQGHKVGWMRSQLISAERTTLHITLHGKIGGMGRVEDVTLEEKRVYNTASQKLENIFFMQSATTGSVKVEGSVQQQKASLSITAGNSTHTQTVDIQETLQDALAAIHLARKGTLHTPITTRHFDASLQKNVTLVYELTSSSTVVLGGITTPTYQMTTRYPELGIEETSWIDTQGKMLESKMGGFFLARLESKEEAQKLDYQHDLLQSAVVKTPTPLQNPTHVQTLHVSMKGFGNLVPPSSARQKVTRTSELTSFTLTADTLKPQPKAKPPEASFTQPTPFIQSNAPALVAAAQQATLGASTPWQKVEKLTSFVYSHIQDAYVPAYSNALEAFTSQRGDCTEHSILFVAMARALGIPARVAVGIAYWPPGNGFGWHAWAEAWVEGQWITTDPTWNQPIADATHIKLAEGGPAEQARIVMLLGELSVENIKAVP
jgi:transglutaminase-like putative cysteine protease